MGTPSVQVPVGLKICFVPIVYGVPAMGEAARCKYGEK